MSRIPTTAAAAAVSAAATALAVVALAPGGDTHDLGLALVAQQATLHRGSVVISEAPSGGARVRLTLAAGAPPRG